MVDFLDKIIYVFFIIVVVVFGFVTYEVLAFPIGDHSIAISLSSKCVTMLKANLTTKCPTYEELVLTHGFDTSDQNISGKFDYVDGFYQRLASPLTQSWKWYDFEETWRIFVDPPQGQISQSSYIIIESGLDYYKLNRDNTIVNNTRYLYHDRWVDDSCRTAIINADLWTILLPDTILYMRNNCHHNFTTLDTRYEIQQESVQHDISTSQKWQHEQWIKNVTENCLTEYGKC